MGYKRTKNYFDTLYKEDLVREHGIRCTEAWGAQSLAIDPEVYCTPGGRSHPEGLHGHASGGCVSPDTVWKVRGLCAFSWGEQSLSP